MNSRTLVKVTAGENGIEFRTISKGRKSPHSFIILRSALEDLHNLPRIIVSDIRSFAELERDRRRQVVRIRFSWLSGNGFRLQGWEETIILPFHALMACAKAAEGTRWSFLSLREPPEPKLVFYSHENLHAAVNSNIVRRKLARALRDNFKWRALDEIDFYDDFMPYSFFFREIRNGEPGICGGLIFHYSDGDVSTGHYSVHT